MRSVLISGLLLLFSTAATAVPLNSWNLGLGAIGGSDAGNITSITVDGTSTLRQDITGNTAFGNPFSMSGSLNLVQYQDTGFNTSNFMLPNGYSGLVFNFQGITGSVDGSGNASFNFGANVGSLVLNDGGAGLALAGFSLLSAGSNAMDIAYYDGFGQNPFYSLNFQLDWALAGLFTDDQGNPILPGAVFSFYVDGLLDWNVLNNPYTIAGIDNTSFSDLVNAGEIGAVNVADNNQVPEPGSLYLLALGLIGFAAIKQSNVHLPWQSM